MKSDCKITVFTKDPVLEQALRLVLNRSLPLCKMISLSSFRQTVPVSEAAALIVDADSLQEEELRSFRILLHTRPDMPVLLLLGMEWAPTLRSDILSQAKVVLRKPFQNRLLIDSLKNILESDALRH